MCFIKLLSSNSDKWVMDLEKWSREEEEIMCGMILFLAWFEQIPVYCDFLSLGHPDFVF